jgi:hypothetical protein
MVDFWVDFIFTGDPNILQGQWSPFEKEHEYLNISGLHSFMGNSDTLLERMALWEEIMSNKTSLETTTQISTTNPTTAPPTTTPTNDPTTSTMDTPVTTNPWTSTDVPTITPTTTPTTDTTDSGATKLKSPFIFLIMFFFAITRYLCNPCK